MPEDLVPDQVLSHLEKGRMLPCYLFHGENKFHMEKVLTKIREEFIPEQASDFNLQVFYSEKAGVSDYVSPAVIIDAARTIPFLSPNRLIIVRRTENFAASMLESFIPYIDEPMETTCLIFVSSKTNFNLKFYKRIRAVGGSVIFKTLYENQVVTWIKQTAKDLGLNMAHQACVYLLEVVGNRLTDLYAELEKLSLRHGNAAIDVEQVRELAIQSRIFTTFELMDQVSFKRCGEAISVLNRFLDEAGSDEVLGVLGMLSRQMRLLWQAKDVIEGGGRVADVAGKIRLPPNLARKVTQQSKLWSAQELERSFHVLYQADGLLKSGSQGRLVLENVVMALCLD